MKLTEEKAAQLLGAMDELLGADGLTTMREKIAALQATVDGMAGLDPKAIATNFERMQAEHDAMVLHLRTKRDRFYVSGIEDIGDQFSVIRACSGYLQGSGSKVGYEAVGAGLEFELMRQVYEKNRDVFAKAGIGIGDDTVAASFIPDQVIADVIAAIYRRAVFFNLQGDGQTRVSVIDGLIGQNVRVPKFDGGCVAYWVDEEAEYAESYLSTGLKSATPHKLGVLTTITQEMEEQMGFGFETLFRNDLIEAAKKKIDWTIAYGRGGNMPLGILNWTGVRVFSAQAGEAVDDLFVNDVQGDGTAAGTTIAAANSGDWDGGELDFDALMDMQTLQEEDDVYLDNSALVSAARYLKRLKQLKIENYSGQTAGNPYLIGVPMLTDGRLRDLIGDFARSSMFAAGLPGAGIGAPTTSTTSSYTDVISGDLRTVIWMRWAGMEITDDGGKGAGFTKDLKYVKLRLRGDTFIRQERKLMVCPDAQIIG